MTFIVIFFFWIALSAAVGMFAEIRRNRSSVGWFLLALVISPLLAFIFCAILQPKEELMPAAVNDEPPRSRDDPVMITTVAGILIVLAIAMYWAAAQ